MTAIPKMSGVNLCALQITIQKMVDAGEDEFTGGLREAESLISALVSGEVVPVKRSEIEAVNRGIMFHGITAPHIEARKILARWLSASTPEKK